MTSVSMTASTESAEFRAAGTDISERRRSGVSRGPLIDIAATSDSIGIEWGADSAAHIGAPGVVHNLFALNGLAIGLQNIGFPMTRLGWP